MKKILALLLAMNSYLSQAQNNPIFSGGAADGWDRNAYAQAGNNIFTGGNGDGWSFATYAQGSNNIYIGGIGDGWSFATFAQVGNGIYNGGNGDGWSSLNFQQAGNNIFLGGQGDGWASTYRALGPLPVIFVSFTAEKQGNASLLQWQTATENNTAHFDVERSLDAVFFQKIGSRVAAGNSSVPLSYSFVDAQPLQGYNYYRLKQVDKNGAFVYTPTRMLLFASVGMQTIKVYPVPATASITVELPASTQNEDVAINLSNALGVTVQQQKLSRYRAGNQSSLNLSTLPAGVYTLQVVSASFNGSQIVIKQ